LANRKPLELGVPTGRFLELSQKTNKREPYSVTDTITVWPTTKKRREDMRDAQLKVMIGNQLLDQAMKTGANDVEVLNELAKQIKTAETYYNRAFFGDCYDALMTFFDDRDAAEWDDFVGDIKAYFAQSVPDDGTCPTCGTVTDEEAAGKAQQSSTG
jgi:hypothetical protein